MRSFVVTALLLSATAFADPAVPPPNKPVVETSRDSGDCARQRAQHKDCVLDMGGESLEANAPVATDAMINFIKWTKSQSLITLRRDFIPEIVKTAEDL
jgi:hypothetical protein